HAAHGRHHADARAARAAGVPFRADPDADHRVGHRSQAGRQGRGSDRLDRQAVQPRAARRGHSQGAWLASAMDPPGIKPERDAVPAGEPRWHEREFPFSDADFDYIRTLVTEHAAIRLADNKRQMVYGRLVRRLRELGFSNFAQYIDLLKADNG